MSRSEEPAKTEQRTGGSATDLLTGVEPERTGGWRESIESFAIAFILAFVFKTFEAEAFVIPTGSMAPTLYGRHKQVDCEKCGHDYAVGASEELQDDWFQPNYRIAASFCPNCRHKNNIKDLPVFKGDRILVNKFPFEFGEPNRWDVTVFKYPEQPNINYIKRLVGLPEETIVIRQGNLYLQASDGTRQILRKDDPLKQNVLQLPVFDNDHPETELHRRGWPSRWAGVDRNLDDPRAVAGWAESAPGSGWTQSDDGRSFSLDSSNKLSWLRYRHYVPEPETWMSHEKIGSRPRPQLVTDFCGYNSYEGAHGNGLNEDCYWVGDLTLGCEITVGQVGDRGRLLLELVEGRRRFRADFDLVAGGVRVTAKIDLNRAEDEEEELGRSEDVRLGTGQHRLRFANVDDRLCLWIDDELVQLGPGSSYRHNATDFPGPGIDDLVPVGIAASGIQMAVTHLQLFRDIYYRSEHVEDPYEADPTGMNESSDEGGLIASLDDPRGWHELYSRSATEAVFRLGPDEFLMLGDNSSKSKDGRLWGNRRGAARRHAVPRSALVGKAFYIYWPHGVPFLNNGRGFPDSENSLLKQIPVFNRWFYHVKLTNEQPTLSDYPQFRVPFYPQFKRMKRIR
ncbi:MAG TPA: signal peptidase I [Planctomycetaceae bacterium]|nr:signal peptidase I [Planctomycetaceae bacterium]|tara:strand:- start:3287 stop:5155 length:1869 start_codon:yes stop_codon:yes gene_type:complete